MDAYYSQIAPGYDELHGREQDAKLRELLARVTLREHATVLDVGCATGRSAAFLPDALWHGGEPSAGLVARATPSVRARILTGRAESLPFGEASFDVVLCVTVLQNVDDATRAMDEMRRVLKPRGILLVSFLRKAAQREAFDRLLRERFAVRESWEFAQDTCYVCVRQE